jgi:hypothetical protein
VPALTAQLDALASQSTCDADCVQTRTTFDLNHDGHITVDEVSGAHTVLGSLLVPDVALFDANGNWAPDPTNAVKDSFSLGVGFQAVPASFIE